MTQEQIEFRTTPENKLRLDIAHDALRAQGVTEEQIKEYGAALTVVVLDHIERKIGERPA